MMRTSFLACIFFINASSACFAGQYFQDFSGSAVGATTFGDGAQLFSTSGSNVSGVVDATFKELQLTDLNTTGTRAAFLLPDLDPGNKVQAFSIKFNLVISAPFTPLNYGADGVSLTFGQVRSLSLTNSTYLQEDGYGTGLTFSIRTFLLNNPGFFLRDNGIVIAGVSADPAAIWGQNGSLRRHFEIDWSASEGLTVRMDGIPLFVNVKTPFFRSRTGDSFVFAARTGSITEYARIDNIVAVTGGKLVQLDTTHPYFTTQTNLTREADKAFDNTNATFWTVSTPTGFVGATLASPSRVRAITLTSADTGGGNQADPQFWRFDGSSDYSTWNPSVTGGVRFVNRQETRSFLPTNTADFSAYRLNVQANVGPTSSVALGEMRMYGVQPYPSFALDTTTITSRTQGQVNWVDYDNDGFLDLLSVNDLWRNNGNGSFTFNTNANLPAPLGSRGVWGDFDNDGDEDFLFTGSENVSFTALYLNNTNGTFTANSAAGLPALYRSTAVAADFDHDGYLDVFCLGVSWSSFSRASFLMHNNGNGTFSVDNRSSIEGLSFPAADMADYNRDGYIDLFETGQDSSFPPVTLAAYLYTNLGSGAFAYDSSVMPGAMGNGSATFTDYDNDGWLDLNICGSQTVQLWRANGAGSFTQNTSNGLAGVRFGQYAWGDYDGDGLPDAAMSGNFASTIFINRGNGTFVPDSNAPGYTQYAGGNAWGDFNNDGALDWASNGGTSLAGGELATILFRNVLGVSNIPPQRPTALGTTNASGLRVTLTWAPPSDDSTPANGLSYDVRLGTTPGGRQIVSPPADTTSGKRRLAQAGRVRGQNRMTLYLPQGTYYWSVQAIDQGFAASAFSTEMVFQVTSGGSAPTATTFGATSVNPTTHVLNGSVDPNGLPTAIWFQWGATTNYGNATSPSTQNFVNVTTYSTNITGLSPGTLYHYRMVASNSAGVSFGNNVSFTTLGNAPALTTQPALPYITNALLVASVNPNNLTTTVWFVWGATTNYGNTTATQVVGNGAASVEATTLIGGLTSGSTYHYRALAANQLGVATGANVSFTTYGTNFIDAILPSGPIAGTSANSPGAQAPIKAIDNTVSTKYLNFDELNTGFTAAPFDPARVVRALTLISAEDAPERDPASYTIEGSMDGTNYTLIASNTVPAFIARQAIQSLGFANETAYPYYRVRFPQIVNAGSANSMQIAEVELMPYRDITRTNDFRFLFVSDSGVAVLSTWDTPFDGRLGTSADTLIATNDAPFFVGAQVQPNVGRTVLKGVEVISSYNSGVNPGAFPSTITVQGGQDFNSFTTLGVFTTAQPTAAMQIQEFPLWSNDTSYAHYRVIMGNPIAGSRLEVGELRLIGKPLSPLENWRYAYFGYTNNTGDAADTADPDTDGDNNLLEFATGGNPAISNSSPLFRIAVTGGIPQVYYNMDTNAMGTVTWIIQSSPGLLSAWSNRNGTSDVVNSNLSIRTIQFVPSAPAPTNEFFRLNVAPP